VANNLKRNAFSLIELLTVLGIIAALVAFAIPSIKAMQKSVDSTGAESMISAALSTARTIAISQQRYAGVRFQKAYDGNNPLKGDQYMIFVINNPDVSNVDHLFVAIPGYKPIKLPENTGIIDKIIRTSNGTSETDARTENANEKAVIYNYLSSLDRTLTDTSAFSIVFTPSGKVARHDIRIRNQKGDYQPTTFTQSGDDQVFNSTDNIKKGLGLFAQDDYAELGLGGEKSRTIFYLYDRDKFDKMTDNTQRWDYLKDLKPISLNPYTGEIINKKK
jgi:prepilin-type N-terminal cleavage/methylation domain-containing protein